MSGEAYVKRYPNGFVDLPQQTTPIDSAFLNAVEQALARLLGADPTDKGVESWDATLARFKTVLLKNENIDPAAGVSRTKLDFGAGLVDADIAPGAAIQASKVSGVVGGQLPAGAMVAYGGSTAPTGWLLCDGSAVSRSTYAGIFSALGTKYGAGDGSNTFNLPDFRGRVPVGVGTHADVGDLGLSDGSALGARRPKHNHTWAPGTLAVGNDTPDHVHYTGYGYFGDGNPPRTLPTYGTANDEPSGTVASIASGGANTRHTHPLSGAPTVGPQTGNEPLDSVSYLTVNVIIKT
jgi:microcystin-dependent protein